MTTKANTFEGGTDGVQVTTGNSGGASGDALSSVGTPILYSSMYAAHGTLSARPQIVTTANAVWMNWAWSPSKESMYLRTYVLVPAAPVPIGILFMRTGDYSVQVGMDASQHFFSYPGPKTGTYLYQAATWYRVEVEIPRGTAANGGRARVRIFVGDATAPVEAFVTTTTDTSASIDAYFGCASLSGDSTSTQYVYLDDCGFSDDKWPGWAVTPINRGFRPRRFTPGIAR
jgi:hypothetical protein